jgi:hypothetical protein
MNDELRSDESPNLTIAFRGSDRGGEHCEQFFAFPVQTREPSVRDDFGFTE